MTGRHEKYEYAIDNLGLSEKERKYISSLQSVVNYKKGTIFVSEGQLVDKCYHVIKGCVRKYHLKDGEEKTTDFYIELDSISTRPGRIVLAKSKFNLECVEDTSLTVLSAEQENILYEKFPRFQEMCRISTEYKLEEYQEKLSKFISSSPEERYLDLMENRPELLNRVPQYQLASFLGIKPESLSRIRKRLMA